MRRRIVTAREQYEMLTPWRIAMPRADAYQGIPEGYTHEIGDGVATLVHKNSPNSWASRLMWYPNGEVKKIDTQEGHQRKGLATYLYNETLKHVPHLHHSEDLTPSGRGWASSMYDWNPDPHDRYDSLEDIESYDTEDGYSGPSDEEIARHEEFARQQGAATEAHWLNFINTHRRSQGKDELSAIPDEWRADLGLRTDRRQALLASWRPVAFIKQARYPQEWRDHAPYGRLPSGRARNRPPSVLRDPDNPDAGILDPSEIRYEDEGDSISAYHPNGDHLGNYSWEEGDHRNPPHIGIAQVNPRYQGQGVSGAIIDYIREHHEPDLVHSGYRGMGSLSYQGRAAALRDLGNTEEEHNDYFNTTPYNYGETEPSTFRYRTPTPQQRQAHTELMQHFEEDMKHPNYTGRRSESSHNPDLFDEDGDRHEYGYDSDGDYVGLESGGKDFEGYSEEGYDHEGYDRDGLDRSGVDREGFDEDGFHNTTGLNRDGKTRHGYTPGDGTAPAGMIPMSQMAQHWAENGLPTSPEHQDMMDSAAGGIGQTMYAVREPYHRSLHDGSYHVGNGDTLYSSLERARQVAYHPDDPSKDKDIISADWIDPDHLHADMDGENPEDFYYAPVSDWDDAEYTASTEASVVHDPQRHQRILDDLGHGWRKGVLPFGSHPSFEYTDPNGGRSGRIHQKNNGVWSTEHQPEFGSTRRFRYDNYRDAAAAVQEGTKPGRTMEQHALEANNHYEATGGGAVDWEPHPNGKGLTAHTPHGDLHVVQDPDTGSWHWHAGPHGSQPGDEGNMRAPFSNTLTSAATAGVKAITRTPFHGGLADELDEGWERHPRSAGAFTRRLPSGNHAFVAKNADGTYGSGIQRDNGSGAPSTSIAYRDDMPDLGQALAFIHHRENPVPPSKLGQGWEDFDRGRQHFPAYLNESHPSGAFSHVAWDVLNGGDWRASVRHGDERYDSNAHKTPQAAAAWANSVMDGLGSK